MSMLKILLAIAFIGSIAALVLLFVRSRKAQQRLSEESVSSPTALSADSPASPTVRPPPPTQPPPFIAAQVGHETSEDLSQSGAMSIRHEITRCVASKKWEKR